MLERFVPPYDATVVARLEAAGAVVVGKTNCDEFAMGSSNENSAFGPTRNPWALDRMPGGSSGGSAAAVAAGLAPLALGSDTGGSIRQPAALCGVVGVKPTYGRVSRYGLIAFGSSLDQIGPFARTVARRGRRALASSPARIRATRRTRATSPPRRPGRHVGRRCLPACASACRARCSPTASMPRVQAAVDAALRRARAAGRRRCVDVELPHAAPAIPVYYLVATAEASSNLARYDGVRFTTRARLGAGDDLATMYDRTRGEGFGAEVKRRIMLGTYVLSAGYYDAYYLKAQQVRTLIKRDYDARLRRASTSSRCRRRRRRRSSSASAPTIRCRCTWPTSSP